MLETIKREFLKLDDDDKIAVVRFVIVNKPNGTKLRDIMEPVSIPEPAFDLDLIDGQIGEHAFLNIATSGKHEVKRDFKASETGNIAVELEYRGRASGLQATNSPYWVYWLSGQEYQDEVAIVITTARLRNISNAFGFITYGGDNQDSLLSLISIKKLLASAKEINEGLRRRGNGNQINMFNGDED